jgi:hypothetical protein
LSRKSKPDSRGLVPAIHVFGLADVSSVDARTSPGMTDQAEGIALWSGMNLGSIAHSAVIARSEATKQSSPLLVAFWIASLRSQ